LGTNVRDMHPNDPAPPDNPTPTPSEPPTSSGGTPGLGGRRRGRLQSRRARLALAMGAGIMALLCIGGASLVFLFYDDATQIDRATPDQVTSSFLRSYLVNRDDQQASLYSCETGANFAQLSKLRQEMVDREANHGTSVTATWESLTVSGADLSRNVAVELVISGSKNGQQVAEASLGTFN
jgi:hypothetical protein